MSVDIKDMTLDEKCAALLKVESSIIPLENKKSEIESILRGLRGTERGLRDAIVSDMLESGCTESTHGHLAFRVKNKPFGIKVTDESLIPADWFDIKTERKLKALALKQAVQNGMDIPGVTRDNGGHVLEIRTKGRHA